MSSRRTMILIAAIAVGCIAAFVVMKYVNGIEDREAGNNERVPVLVVRADIAQGTPGEQAVEQQMVVEDEIAREFLPATRITDLDQISGKIALNNLSANQVLVDGMFVDPAETSVSAITQRLEDNHVAYTISVDEVSGVAGLLVPGDLVNILVTTPSDGAAETSGDDAAGLFGQNARMLYQQVRILAIGSQTAPPAGEEAAAAGSGEADPAAEAATSSGLLTLDLPIEAAQIIASVPTDAIRLTLTGPDYTPEPMPALDFGDLATLPGETGGELTPYGPDGPQ